MLQSIWSQILSLCYCKVCDLLSLSQMSYRASVGVVHTLSFQDAALIIKNIGAFKKARKPITSFTRS